MALIDEMKTLCGRLAPLGWANLLGSHGFDLGAADLGHELARPLLSIDRTVPGFEDFAFEGQRAIEPGSPHRSLLYHALASPNVLQVGRADLLGFPTLRELEVVENYVFGVRPPSLPELSALAAGDMLAVVVFATEYRPAVDSVHRRHAELCFARTGVARVGTKEPAFDPRHRGFVPVDERDPHAFRVLPARYSAWIAVQRSGSEASFGPMRFSFRARHPALFEREGQVAGPDDSTRKFWVPLHKLFDGPECVQGLDLKVSLMARHINEKLRRVHLEIARRGADTGWGRPDIDQAPFRFGDGIAEFSRAPEDGEGLLVPVAHPALVEAAEFRGEGLTFRVPAPKEIGSRSDFLPTFEISARSRVRRAPEYVHVRTAPGETPTDLNELPDPGARVERGGYDAQHYIDFTGDGWVEASCSQLRAQIPRFIAAYSLVAAPDFFFGCDQRDVMDWWLERVPSELRGFIWSTPPFTLSDERIAPNLKLNNVDFRAGDPTLPKAGFRPEDDTVTAVVSMPIRGAVQDRPLIDIDKRRHNSLPDGAAGYFAPGWDTSIDQTAGVAHLAAYGLGSPFPEDAKLCAALSTFWPAAAPDAGRSFSQVFATVSPLTDEEIGSVGSLPWDGVTGPKLVGAGATAVVEYADFNHVDYVLNARDNRFSLSLTSKIGTEEYMGRVIAMARAYLAVGVPVASPEQRTNWNVLSFRHADPNDADLPAAHAASKSISGEPLSGTLFRFELYQPVTSATQPTDPRKQWIGMRNRRVVFVGGGPVVAVGTDGAWRPAHV